MSGTTEGTKIWIHLYGGEQDGFRRKIEVRTKAPKRFYIWHVNDGAKIEETKGPARGALQNRLATMAYQLFDKLDEADEGLPEYRYRRLESADKVTADPVT